MNVGLSLLTGSTEQFLVERISDPEMGVAA
jgi:hypothetical protein